MPIYENARIFKWSDLWTIFSAHTKISIVSADNGIALIEEGSHFHFFSNLFSIFFLALVCSHDFWMCVWMKLLVKLNSRAILHNSLTILPLWPLLLECVCVCVFSQSSHSVARSLSLGPTFMWDLHTALVGKHLRIHFNQTIIDTDTIISESSLFHSLTTNQFVSNAIYTC